MKLAGKFRSIIWAGLLAAVLALSSLMGWMTAWAETASASGEDSGNTVIVDAKQEDLTFSIYRLADIISGETGETYQLSGDFAQYAVSMVWKNSDEAKTTAETLAVYVARDNIKPKQSQKTGTDGKLSFSNLEDGVYLVIGDDTTRGGKLFRFTPVLLRVPGLDEDGSELTVQTMIAKGGSIDKMVSIKAVKVWQNDTEKNRPSEITVQLLKGKEVVDEKVLNADNGWYCEWKDLKDEGGISWSVAEKNVPSGYKYSLSSYGNTFVIVNTYTPPTEKETNPPSGGTTSKIPQTGLLWWPVPLLAIAGMLLIICGIFDTERDREK